MIICDIDGTIADISHRLHFIQDQPKDWDSFFAECIHDRPIIPVIEAVKRLSRGSDLYFLTGRPESIRRETFLWLERVGFFLPSVRSPLGNCSDLIMRRTGDHRPDTRVKPELLLSYLSSLGKDESSVDLILEDRSSMVKVWRDMGFLCFQVAAGDY